MLAKKERLDRVAFNRSFSLGKRFHTASLTLIYVPSPSFRASAVAPKKTARTAVLRNKFRRRIYDAFRHMRDERTFLGTFICIAKDGAPERPYGALKEELRSLVHKTGALG